MGVYMFAFRGDWEGPVAVGAFLGNPVTRTIFPTKTNKNLINAVYGQMLSFQIIFDKLLYFFGKIKKSSAEIHYLNLKYLNMI